MCTAASLDELISARRKSDQEMVLHVDASNRVVGSVTRREMRANNLLHRASYILILNDQHQLYVQKRVSTKDYCAGHFDPCTGGVVAVGEGNEENAYRELSEEMGVDLLSHNQALAYHGCFLHRSAETSVWGNLYSCTWNGPIAIQETEVESAHLKTIEQIKQEFKEGVPYCPDSMTALYHFIVSRDLERATL